MSSSLENHPPIGTEVPKLTPEQEEEVKLRNKYPNPQKPGGSAFVQKLLHKGNKKYFDSGDYNMARSKIKANNKPTTHNLAEEPQQNNNDSTTPTSENHVEPLSEQQQHTETETSLNTTPQAETPTVVVDTAAAATANTTDVLNTSDGQVNIGPSPTNIGTPVVVSSSTQSLNTTGAQQQQQQTLVNLSTSLSATSSPSLNTSLTLNHQQSLMATPNTQQQHPTLSSSISASSIQHLMMSSSISADKLSNIHLNPPPTQPNVFDSEEIGHGIPTPECLPQSRKHSIAQSKLVATPRLSTS